MQNQQMALVTVTTFAKLPPNTQTSIVESFKTQYASSGELGTQAEIESQARAMAEEHGYSWTPTRHWVQTYLKLKCLGIVKRPYRKDGGYDPEVESIMAFIREQMGEYSECTINRYRSTVAGFLKEGFTNQAAIEGLKPDIYAGDKMKSASLAHMKRYYERQAKDRKRPRLADAAAGMPGAQVDLQDAHCSMEVDTPACPDTSLEENVTRGMDQMTIRELATSVDTSGEHPFSAMLTERPMFVTNTCLRSGRVTGIDAPIAASTPSSSLSQVKRSSLKSLHRAELMEMCEAKGLEHNGKATKDVLISKLLDASTQPESIDAGHAPVGGEQPREQLARKAGFSSVGQMDTVLTAMRGLLTHCELDELNWVAGMSCYYGGGSDVDGALPQGYYCDVTPGRCGSTDQFYLVGIQRDLSEYTHNHYKVMLSLLKAAYPVFLRHGFKPRAGYDPFNEDQLIWLVALTSGVIKLGTSATAVVFLALFTRFFDCRMRPDTAVTGELTLAGTLGGIDSVGVKLEGAKCWGIKRMVVPERNWREVSEEFKNDPEIEVVKADDVIELLNCCLEEGQGLRYKTAFRHLRWRVPVSLRVRKGAGLDLVECTAYPGTGKVLITGTEPDDEFELLPTAPSQPAPQPIVRPRRNRAQSAADVSRLWLCKVQGEEWFEALPKGRRRFDLRHMVMWEDTTLPDNELGPPPSARAAGQAGAVDGEEGEEKTVDPAPGAEGPDTMGSSEVLAIQTEAATSAAASTAAASSLCDGESDEIEGSSTTVIKSTCAGRVGEVKADLHIHFPDCRDDANIGLAVAIALAQLMRGKLTPMEVSAMGEASVDGRLVPMKRLGLEQLTSEIAQKVITVQYEGDEGFSVPKVPANVRVIGVSNMREALQEAFRNDNV